MRDNNSDQQHCQVQLEERGVRTTLLPVLVGIPREAELLWLTYSFGPPPEVLDTFDQRRITARFVCSHPRGGPQISEPNWARFKAAKFSRARAHRTCTTRGLDDEADELGLLHAKIIVWRTPGWGKYGLVTGSFNATGAAWNDNLETTVLHDDPRAARRAWKYCESIWHSAVELTDNDIGTHVRRSHKFEELGAVEGSSRGTAHRTAAPHDPPTIVDPESIAAFAAELHRMLTNHPTPGVRVQWDVYCDLVSRGADDPTRRDILYLPVGVGKTFIALRWLCDHLSGAEDGYTLYLAPNEWVQRTVLAHIDTVAEQAEVNATQIKNWIRVLRPAQSQRLTDMPYAAVADECHHWNSEGGKAGSYTAALDECLDQCPTLGVSATPCRMEDERFNVELFVQQFVNRSLDVNESEPFLSMDQARRAGFICAVEFRPILDEETAEEIKQLLTDDDGSLVEMGDYSSVTLRHAWQQIASDPAWLAERIWEELSEHARRRIVVFVPPVGDDSDEFVEELRARSSGTFVDFRARSGGPASREFQRFANAPADADAPPVLVTIDRFGEGVSVDDIDALVMLRATLSPRVAVQALGRGLRPAPRKDHCLVLDAVLFEQRIHMFEEPTEAEGPEGPEVFYIDEPAPKTPRKPTERLRKAILHEEALSALRYELTDTHNRVPYRTKLGVYVDALLQGNPDDMPEFSAAALAKGIRSGHVRGVLSVLLETTEGDIRERIRDLELPGSRRGDRIKSDAATTRDELLAGLKDYLHIEFGETGGAWAMNSKGQECLHLRKFQLVRIYDGGVRTLQLAVRTGSRNDYERMSITSEAEFGQVRDAMVRTDRV